MKLIATSCVLALLLIASASDALVDAPLAYAESAVEADAKLPATDGTATESSALIWLGPVAMGVFAFALALVIRRYSKPMRQAKAQAESEVGSQGESPAESQAESRKSRD